MTRPAGRRATRTGAATAAVAALLLAGCGDAGGAGGGTGGDTSYVAGDGSVTVVPAAKREAPVEATATTLDGERLSLAALRGRPVVVNVWASWCKPCRLEAPELAAAAAELEPQGVGFVGINTRDQDAAAKAFERRFKVGYPSLVDSGSLLLAFDGAVSPASLPTTVVLDEQGRIAARFTGKITRRTLVGLVQDARGQRPT